jgi:hypothetical protein
VKFLRKSSENGNVRNHKIFEQKITFLNKHLSFVVFALFECFCKHLSGETEKDFRKNAKTSTFYSTKSNRAAQPW